MKITRDNYESWFLDYLEGNLEERKMDEFIEFILENPDLKAELLMFEPVTLNCVNLHFRSKEQLYKEVFDLPEEFDQAAVALIEGDPDTEKAKAFNDYLHCHPEKQKEIDLFRITRLKPDLSVRFPSRKRLYHYPAAQRLLIRTVRVAAVLLITIAIYTLSNRPSISPDADITIAETPAGELIRPEQTADLPAENILAGNNGKIAEIREVTTNKPAFYAGEKTAVIIPSEPENDLTAETIIHEEELALLSVIEGKIEVVPDKITLIIPESYLITETLIPGEPDNRPLSEKFMEKTGLADLSFSKLTRMGLNLAADLSNDKLCFATAPSGEIVAFKFDTRLVGLSIPVRTREKE